MMWWFRAVFLSAFMVFGGYPVSASEQDGVDAGVTAFERGDYKAAIRMWMPRAEAGDVDALFNLGQLYRMGRGVPPDPVMAEYFYGRAAAQGHVAAQGNLGTLYYFAFDDSTRIDDALVWWLRAARAGDARSQYMLGVLYYNGEHLARDPARAYAWIHRAAQSGLAEAVRAESNLIRALSVAELARGNDLVPGIHDLPLEGDAPSVAADTPARAAYRVQLGAITGEELARNSARQIERRNNDLVNGKALTVEVGHTADGKEIHRVFLDGFETRGAAREQCARFQEAGQDCFVVSR